MDTVDLMFDGVHYLNLVKIYLSLSRLKDTHPWNISHTKFVFFNMMIVVEEVLSLKKTSIFGANAL